MDIYATREELKSRQKNIFDLKLNVVTDSKDSILAAAASWIAPIFKPLGFGDWKISTALITGFMTNGTASPLNIVPLKSSAIRIPISIPPKYNATITTAPCFGKNAAVKNA